MADGLPAPLIGVPRKEPRVNDAMDQNYADLSTPELSSADSGSGEPNIDAVNTDAVRASEVEVVTVPDTLSRGDVPVQASTGVASDSTGSVRPADQQSVTGVAEGGTAVAGPDSGADGDSGADRAESGADGADSGDDDGEGSDNPLETEGEVAADYLEELLDIADLDGDIDTYVEGDRAHVSIVSESQVLVGANGEVLDALQELTRLAVMTETGDRSRLMLDIAGFRDRRRKELTILATDAIQEAKESDDRVSLAAMNPFERKIVHDTVAAAGLTSESEGEEPRRHVVVVPV